MNAFNRIGIINRGEPAMRFLRALSDYNLEHGCDLESVALYTDPDEGAPFMRHADRAIGLGPAMQDDGKGGLASAYIRHEAIIEVLRDAGCDAVWPGWGFVSEDAAFVAKLEAAGIVFLGPSSQAMGRLGDKIEAKYLAETAGVPLAAWAVVSTDEDPAILRQKGETVGYPLMVKASAGGGGRGIRKVSNPDALVEAIASVTDEVARLFGAGGVFIERCITGARHIEVQLVVGADGVATALGVRDCSIQRRNQKVIEEAPSCVLPDAMGVKLCDASARLAEAAGYRGVATAEYLYNPTTGDATFLEVNSRLQVEHTVTEAIFGVDLVQAQIDIALGRPWTGADATPRGHAIEVRLNAEDPEQGFAPRPGHLRVLQPPSGPGVRVDSGVAEGMVIAPEFDSMIAKIIVHGATRRQAIARMERALSELRVVVEDGATNKAFLLELLRQPPFLDGSADTAWLDRAVADGELARPRRAFEALIFAAIVVYERQRHGEVHEFFGQVQNGIPQNPPKPGAITVDLLLRGAKNTLSVMALGRDRYMVAVEGQVHEVTAEAQGAHGASMRLRGSRHDVMYTYGRAGIGVEVDGAMNSVELASGGTIKALMPAIVVHIAVAEGDRVEAGDRLLVLEAMKMEMPQYAAESGVVREVLCTPNQLLTVGQPLIVLEPDAVEGSEPAKTAEGLTLLPPLPAPLQSIYDGTFPTIADLDTRSDEDAKPFIYATLDAITAALLGYDTGATAMGVFNTLLGDLEAIGTLKNPGRWAAVANLIVVYADTGVLFDRSLVPEGDGISAQTGFYDFCREHHEGEEGADPSLAPLLTVALAHFGLRDLEASEPLRRALWRLAIGHTRGAAREQLGALLLRFVPALFEAGVAFPDTLKLSESLTRVARVADPKRGKNIADGARQAMYILFQRSRYQAREGRAEARLEAELRALAGGADSGPIVDALAESTDGFFPLIVGQIHPSHPALTPMVEVLIRRIYSEGITRRTHEERIHGIYFARYEIDSGARTVLALVGDAKNALSCVDAAPAMVGADQPCDAIELMLAGSRAVQDDAAITALIEGPNWHALPARRVTLTWVAPRGFRHRTWKRASIGDAWALQDLLHDIHPEHARRFELGRLSEFDVTRLDAPEGVCAFQGHARENPRDERVFVYVSVRGLGQLSAPVRSGDDALLELEQAFFEGLRVLRHAQASRSARTRLHWNRMTLYIRHPVVAGIKDISRVAHFLEGPTRDLGLEKIVVRCTLIDPAGDGIPRALAVAIAKPTGHRLQVTIHEPSSRPVRALSDYQLNLVKARRLGYVYPYEIAKMLEGGRGHGRALDPDMERGTFVEYDLDASGEKLVPIDRPYGQNQAGVVVGLMTNHTAKHPEGMTRVWIAADPTKSICALAEPECRRVNAALRLAREMDLPVEWLSISAGARIAMDSGTENLDWTAQVLREITEFTQDGGVIHIIVSGVNVGAQSYWNAEATMLMHTRGLLIMTAAGSMVLTGKKALEFSGGVAAEDELGIGGFERIMGPNGQAQIFARDLGEAYTHLFEHYRVSYRAPGEAGPRLMPTTDPSDRSILNHPYTSEYGEGFATVGEIFDDATNPGRKRPFAIRQVMAAVSDQDSSILERFRGVRHGETAVVWDAHLGGHPICMIGFESRPLARRGRIPMDGPGTWTGGTLFPRSSKKVARALNAASGNRPVVVLANLSGFDGSPESLRELQLEYGAEIGRAVVNFKGPLIFVVIGRYHGGAYVVFSKALNKGLVSLALEGSFASVIGGGPAAAVVFPRMVRQRALADGRVIEAQEDAGRGPSSERAKRQAAAESVLAEVLLEKQGEVAHEFDGIHTVGRAVDVGSLDAVIQAARLRPEIIERLNAARKKA